MIEFSAWVVTANADNGVATASKAASGNNAHYITSVSGGFSGTAAGKALILKSGSTEIARWYVFDENTVSLGKPLKVPPGAVANLELEASGTGGRLGAATMTGYTV